MGETTFSGGWVGVGVLDEIKASHASWASAWPVRGNISRQIKINQDRLI